MPQSPRQKPEGRTEKPDPEKKDTWGEDQEKHGYYYDDAHGYETYDPEKDEDPENEADRENDRS